MAGSVLHSVLLTGLMEVKVPRSHLLHDPHTQSHTHTGPTTQCLDTQLELHVPTHGRKGVCK